LSPTPTKTTLTDLLWIALITGTLFGIFLGAYPFINPDEGRYSNVTQHMILTGNYLVPMVNGIPFFDKPILFYWCQSIIPFLTGVINEWTLRAWPAIISVIGCLGTYFTASKLVNRRTGWLASLILASSGFYFAMAHFTNLDLTVAIFITLSLYCFLLAMQNRDTPRPGYLIPAYLFCGLAILTKGFIGLVFPIMVIALWAFWLKKWKLILNMKIIIGLIIIAVMVLPWFIAIQHKYPDFLHYFIVVQQVQRFLAHTFNDKESVLFYPELILGGLFPWTIFFIGALLSRCKTLLKPSSSQALPIFLLLWILSITLFFSIPASKTAGYILPVFPAAAFLTAHWLNDVIEQHDWRIKLTSVITAMLFILLAIALPFIANKPHLFVVKYELYAVSSIVFLAAMIILILHATKQHRYIPIFTCLSGIGTGLMLMTALAYHSNALTIRTSKPLATILKQHLKPGEKVYFYHYYYHDLPIYLNRPIYLIEKQKSNVDKDDWKHDFLEGLQFKQNQHLMLTDKQFKLILNEKKSIYIFTITSQIPSLKKLAPYQLTLIGRYGKLELLSTLNVT